MNELIYNIKMTLGFIIIIGFVLYRQIKLEGETLYHGNDFEGLTQDFSISTGSVDTTQKNIIYILPNNVSDPSHNCLTTIPDICIGTGSSSIKCLAKLKEKGHGFYNNFYFKSSDRNCRTF